MACLICLVSVMICISTAKSLFIGHVRIVLIFTTLTIAPLISESLLGNTRVRWQSCDNPQASGHFFIKK